MTALEFIALDEATPQLRAPGAGDTYTAPRHAAFPAGLSFTPASELTIASGVVTVTGSYHTVDTQADAPTDDLDTINGAVNGMVLVIQASNTARTVVVKNNTGNILLPGGDVSLDDTTKALTLIYSSNLTKWAELSRSDIIGLTDGDKGDVTVSSSGAVWTIDNNVVTYAKMQDVTATSRVLGRKTSGAGDVEECTLSEVLDFIGSPAQGDILYRGSLAWSRLGAGTNGYYLQTQGAAADPQWAAVPTLSDGDKGDITVSSSGTVWTIDNAAVSFAKFQNVAGLSVVGRSANSSGVSADITAANDAEVLRRSGTSIGFGTVATAGIADDAVTDAKLRESAGLSVIGRSANTTGNPADIAAANDAEVLRRSGTSIGFGTVATGGIANDAVTYAKIQNVSTTDRILGRDTAGAGDVEECTLSQVLDFVGSAAQGDIFYRNATVWTRLGAGTSGQFLQTLGAGADPAWATGGTASPTFIATQSTASGTSVAFTSIPQTYKTLLFEVLGVSHDSGSTQTFQVELSGDNGSTYTTAQQVTNTAAAASVTLYGGVSMPCYTKDGSLWSSAVGSLSTDVSQSSSNIGRAAGWRIAGGIDAVRFSMTGGNLDAGTINLWGL